MEVEPLLFILTSEPDVTVCTKDLAVSLGLPALLKHNIPGVTAFRWKNGYVALMVALGSDTEIKPSSWFNTFYKRTIQTIMS
ncbi:hypothetical protein MKW94_002567 [Papaver nudicaule]|uniref:Uncharacterized protein n=1 Tax=Papaver nudicaule TaxID=74823 RepID=A0AA41VWV2_PAPNU|nr:hypothetical protein [Papaver nudicaule]